jgi:hypothetical protein
MSIRVLNAGALTPSENALFDASDPRFPNTLAHSALIVALTAAGPGADPILEIEIGMRAAISKELRGRADRIELEFEKYRDDILANPVAFIQAIAVMLRYRADTFIARCDADLGAEATADEINAMLAYQRPRLEALRKTGLLEGEADYPEPSASELDPREAIGPDSSTCRDCDHYKDCWGDLQPPAPIETNDNHRLWRFENGYGASVIRFGSNDYSVMMAQFNSPDNKSWSIPADDFVAGIEVDPLITSEEELNVYLKQVANMVVTPFVLPAPTWEFGNQKRYRFANGYGIDVLPLTEGLSVIAVRFTGTAADQWEGAAGEFGHCEYPTSESDMLAYAAKVAAYQPEPAVEIRTFDLGPSSTIAVAVAPTFTPILLRERAGVGTQRIYRFPNGFGVSVIDSGSGSSVFVVKFNGPDAFDWDFPELPEGVGHYSDFEQTPEQVQACLEKIAALPEVQS